MCKTEDKTATVVVTSYCSFSRNPICFKVLFSGCISQGIDIICVHDERGKRKDSNQRLVYNELWHYDVILRYYVAVL